MSTITKIVEIRAGKRIGIVDTLGSIESMTVETPYTTLICDRTVLIEEWFDPITFDGFERHTHTLDQRDE